MVCRMPVVRLPENLLEKLENEDAEAKSSGVRGVALYATRLGDVGAEIYVGLHLDGFRIYENINSVDPTIKMQFSLEPVITCRTTVLTYNPDVDNTIDIRVSSVVFSRLVSVGKCAILILTVTDNNNIT